MQSSSSGPNRRAVLGGLAALPHLSQIISLKNDWKRIFPFDERS